MLKSKYILPFACERPLQERFADPWGIARATMDCSYCIFFYWNGYTSLGACSMACGHENQGRGRGSSKFWGSNDLQKGFFHAFMMGTEKSIYCENKFARRGLQRLCIAKDYKCWSSFTNRQTLLDRAICDRDAHRHRRAAREPSLVLIWHWRDVPPTHCNWAKWRSQC